MSAPRHRSGRPSSIFDLVVWDQFAWEGVLRHTDGALSRTHRYRGPDLDASTADELAGLSRLVTTVLSQLGDGWLVHFDAIRLPAPDYPEPGEFTDAFSRALDEERRRAFEERGAHFHTRYYLTLTWRPHGGASAGFGYPRRNLEREKEDLREFVHATRDLRALLETQFEIWPLSSPQTLNYLHTTLTLREQEIVTPRYATPLEPLLAAAEYTLGREIRISEHHLLPIAIGNFPDTVDASTLDWLHELPIPLRMVVRYIPLDLHTARGDIERVRGRWKQSAVSLRDLLGSLLGSAKADRIIPRSEKRFAPTMAGNAEEALFDL